MTKHKRHTVPAPSAGEVIEPGPFRTSLWLPSGTAPRIEALRIGSWDKPSQVLRRALSLGLAKLEADRDAQQPPKSDDKEQTKRLKRGKKGRKK